MLYLNALLILLLSIPLGLGIGGGGLFLVYLTDILSIPRDSAVYLNLVFFLSALLSSAFMHFKNGRISFPFLVRVLLFGIPSAFLGRAVASLLPARLLRLLLGLFLFGSGVFTFITRKKAKDTAFSLDKQGKKHYNNM